MSKIKAATVEEYIQALPREAQHRLLELRAILRRVAPKAKETLKWGVPVLEEGRILFAYAAFKKHLNFVPTQSALIPFKKELATYTTGKDSVQFPHAQSLPKALIRKIAVFRVKQVREKGATWKQRKR